MKVNATKLTISALVAFSLLSASAAVYYHREYSRLKADPQAAADQEVGKIVAEVGKLMALPDERPTVATVTDPAQLKGQAFFANAKTGDKVIIFTGARKAILYDPVARKILEVAPLNAGPADASASAK